MSIGDYGKEANLKADFMGLTRERFENVWSFVKHESHSEELTLDLKHCAIELACSAIQVATMAQKFIDSQKGTNR